MEEIMKKEKTEEKVEEEKLKKWNKAKRDREACVCGAC